MTKCFKKVPEGFYRLPKMAKQAQEGQKWATRPPKMGKIVPRKGQGGSQEAPGRPKGSAGDPQIWAQHDPPKLPKTPKVSPKS